MGMLSMATGASASGTPNTWSCSVGDTNAGCTPPSTITPLPSPHGDMRVTGLGGKIYSIGGDFCYTAGPCPQDQIVEVYDPVHNTWACSVGDTGSTCSSTTITPLPTPRVYGVAVAANGLIYVIGGAFLNGWEIVEAYDPVHNTWSCSQFDTHPGCSSSTLMPLQSNLDYTMGDVGPNGLVYVLSFEQTMAVYDPVRNTWTGPVTIPPVDDYDGAAFGSDGRLYVVGTVNTSGGGYASVMEAYDPLHGSWTCSRGDPILSCPSRTLAPPPARRTRGASVLAWDARIEVIGGEYLVPASIYATQTVEAYDPQQDQWECSTDDTSNGCAMRDIVPMPTARIFMGLAVGPDKRTYAVGGEGLGPGNGNAVNKVEAYTPCSDRPTITLTGMVYTPIKQAQITVQDAASGIQSIVVTKAQNVIVTIPPFTPGTTSPILVTATRTSATVAGTVGLVATNGASCATAFDPVLLDAVRAPGQPVVQTVTDLAVTESQVTILNGTPGLSIVTLLVNGRVFPVTGLRDGEHRTVSIASALNAGLNTVKIVGLGRTGASATLLIGE